MKHSEGFLNIVNDAKSRIREVSVAETQARNPDAKLIDVREDNECDIETTVPDKATELILYCGGGYRSALATDALQKMGYTNVFSMAGGWKAWKEAGGKIE
jgi:rhodanese-related sulfurtransferase